MAAASCLAYGLPVAMISAAGRPGGLLPVGERKQCSRSWVDGRVRVRLRAGDETLSGTLSATLSNLSSTIDPTTLGGTLNTTLSAVMATPKARKKGLVGRAKSALLAARRRWGLSLVRFVVSLVVRIELMALQDPEEAAGLLSETFEATRQGIADFTERREYKFGDISTAAVQNFAGSTMAMVTNYTGKEAYRFGDITKATVSKLTGKESYEFGDITKTAVKTITGKEEYEFGDITKTAAKKIGKEASEFGDMAKTAVKKFTGKDEYTFGDITKAAMSGFQREQKDADT